jgi:hypothetical protein
MAVCIFAGTVKDLVLMRANIGQRLPRMNLELRLRWDYSRRSERTG